MKSNIVVFLSLFITISVGAQTFSSALDHYFMTGDLTQAQLYIGRTVANEDMKEVGNKYPGNGLRLTKSKPRLGVSVSAKNSKVILYSLTSKLIKGKNSYEIWDVKGIQVASGYTMYAGRLMTQSPDFPNGNMELNEAIGLLVLKEGERVPEEKRLVPNWILTADKEGRLLLVEPKDKSKYLFMPGGPI